MTENLSYCTLGAYDFEKLKEIGIAQSVMEKVGKQ